MRFHIPEFRWKLREQDSVFSGEFQYLYKAPTPSGKELLFIGAVLLSAILAILGLARHRTLPSYERRIPQGIGTAHTRLITLEHISERRTIIEHIAGN